MISITMEPLNDGPTVMDAHCPSKARLVSTSDKEMLLLKLCVELIVFGRLCLLLGKNLWFRETNSSRSTTELYNFTKFGIEIFIASCKFMGTIFIAW